MATTGNFRTSELLQHEAECIFVSFNNEIAVRLGQFATTIGLERNLPITIQIQIGEWVVFKAALPGSKPENDGWIKRKANVVLLKQHSTMYERVKAEEAGVDWHQVNGVEDATHAIHGGGFPLKTAEGMVGILLISGLPQVEDHLLAVEILRTYLSK
jgi:uncharacterized protein (UPF0303 family)